MAKITSIIIKAQKFIKKVDHSILTNCKVWGIGFIFVIFILSYSFKLGL